jgi:hypothetical protein
VEDKEPIYDEQIAPLMTEIIRIAKEHEIPMLASFQLSDGDEEDGPLMCSTFIPQPGCTEKLHRATEELFRSEGFFAAVTVKAGEAQQ